MICPQSLFAQEEREMSLGIGRPAMMFRKTTSTDAPNEVGEE
jgi:hypothetical protein